ncbi:dTDP-4-dehydrorhamnose 3,5-epimerase [Fodinicurvata sp. EGI_FJ10296]|uniref:dTDP-4-dehydrorhamnose 3,5-epimerase n=1 Tax=Fodinicurvata sp. EGI_FJ10296 TaxID=3231908 RepID=UPI003455EB6D
MIIEPLPIEGAFLIRPTQHVDERGLFARTYCRETFLKNGLKDCGVQCSISRNWKRGTLRGMHFQRAPYMETKLVRCARGAIYDVIVDLRVGLASRGQWYGVVLSAENGFGLYVPQGFAHGFLTLCDEVEVDYQMAEAFVPGYAAGFRWDDPAIAIDWPETPEVINNRDRALPAFADAVT